MAGESGPEKVNVQAKTLSETPLPLRLAGATAPRNCALRLRRS